MNDDPRDTKVVLITGTSTGIGLELAVELAKRGARVFASMRDVKKAAALQLAATIAGVAVELVALDVTSDESVREAVAHVESLAGRIDAAVAAYGPIEFTSQADVETMFATNIVGCAFADMFAAVAPDPAIAAAMVADACLVASPGIRHPLSGQATIDAAHAVPDDDYLRLCAYDDEGAAIVARNGLGPVWLIG
jgi:NAD(P)-dependent dehydrogenase (short-subunit alcohol dehydrogenase family)